MDECSDWRGDNWRRGNEQIGKNPLDVVSHPGQTFGGADDSDGTYVIWNFRCNLFLGSFHGDSIYLGSGDGTPSFARPICSRSQEQILLRAHTTEENKRLISLQIMNHLES